MKSGETVVRRASEWCYRGTWSLVTNWLKVPVDRPTLRGADDEAVRSFRPADGYLRYLKFLFWIALAAIDIALIIVWLVLFVVLPIAGIVITPLALAIIILPDLVAYIAIHLRFDTTWYVLSDRSMRIRRGIWTIHETTITYENIQNVSIRQGPVQRYFGIADVIVETAGGGASSGKGESATVAGHHGLLEGIANAQEVRELILRMWNATRSAGLGDDHALVNRLMNTRGTGTSWNPKQLELLEAIRDLALKLAHPSSTPSA